MCARTISVMDSSRSRLNYPLLRHFYGTLIDFWLYPSRVIVNFFTIPSGTIEFYDKFERTARDGEAKLCLAIKLSCLQLFGNFQLGHARTIFYSLLSDYRRVDIRDSRRPPSVGSHELPDIAIWTLLLNLTCATDYSSSLLLLIMVRSYSKTYIDTLSFLS